MNRVYSILTALPVALLVSGCAGLARPPAAPAPAPETAAPALPAVPLTADILYDLLLGEIAAQRGQYDVSVTTLGRAALKTRDPRLLERATLAGLYARRPADALKTARVWVELQPNSVEARDALATTLLETGATAEAQVQLEKVLALSPGTGLGQAYLRIAASLGRHQNRDAALEIMQVLVRLHPDRPEAHFALAHLAVRVADLDKAIASIDQALSLRPDWQDAAQFKARVLVSRKDVQKVLAFYDQFLEKYPRATSLRTSYARYLIDLKQWDRAREQFKRVVADSPKDAEAMFAVGLLSLQTNEFDEADRYLRRTLELQPDNDQARLYLGQVAEQRKQYGDAERWYREIEGGQHLFEAQARLAIVIAKQGNLRDARALLHRLQPESETQRVQLVLSEEQILRDAKEFRESLAVLTKAIEQIPGNTDLLYARALVAERLNMIDLHEKDLRQILKKDPKNAHALNALGYTLADRTTRYAEALELIQRALALKPDDPFIMDSMGWVQYRMGNHAEAIKYLQSALEKRNDAEISAHLGEVLWVMGDRAGAESVWTRALKHTPDSEALLGVIKKFKP